MSKNPTRDRRRELGQCIDCGVDTGGKIRCEACKKKSSDIQMRRASRNIARGVCKMCGQKDALEGHRHCAECLVKVNAATVKHAAKRRLEGRCIDCGKQTDATSRCRKCLDRINARTKEDRRERLEKGLCRHCGKPAILLNRVGQFHMPGGLRKAHYCETCFFRMTASYVLGSATRWQELVAKLDACNWRCSYTGAKLILGENLSFDHIDPVCRFPERKHDISNIEPVTMTVNLMKRHLTKNEFLALVKDIYDTSCRH